MAIRKISELPVAPNANGAEVPVVQGNQTRRMPVTTIARDPQSYLLVQDVDDLPEASNGEHVLPADTLVEIAGTIDIGANALRLSEGTLLRGMGGDRIISSADGVVRATGLDEALVMREFTIIATGGRCLDLSGPIDQQLNLFFLGLIGAAPGTSAGTINGFDVQAVKACYIDAPDGFTFGGTTNKLFVHETPFYSITGSAITLAANLNVTVVDLVTGFFKFDSPGVCITAEAGYQVGDGLLRGSLIDGTATPLEGLGPSDINWKMTDNIGVRDSAIAGQVHLTEPLMVNVTTQGDFVALTGNMSISAVSERFVLDGSKLEYTGRYPSLVSFNAAFTVDPANNDRIAIRAMHNDVSVAETETVVEQGAGPGSSPRAASIGMLRRIEPGDTISVAMANLDDTDNFEIQRCTFTVRG